MGLALEQIDQEEKSSSGLTVPIRLPAEFNLDGCFQLDTWPVSQSYERTKRVIDVVGAAALIVLTLPIMLLAALVIRLSGPGPAVFRQRRAGRGGEPFTMLKFRTMVPNAPSLRNLFPGEVGRNGPTFKLEDDPRVTRVGRILRKTSIDELPQLFNVLAGSMSLVGPRPLPLDEVRLDSVSERARLSVKPGLTGLWQISGRSEIPYDEWVELDLYYVQNRTTVLDLQILLRTLPAVLSCRGAY